MAHAAVKHDYHLVDPSPWPIVTSMALFVLALGAVIFMKGFVADPLSLISGYFADEAAAKAAIAGGWKAVEAGLQANAGFQALSAELKAKAISEYQTSQQWFWLLGKGDWIVLGAGFLLTAFGAASWWGDVVKESHKGDHTAVVGIGLRYGMILFIASEVMFFVAWFWMFFEVGLFADERTLSTIPEVASAWAKWPPEGVETLDPFHLPLMNTLTLLLSGTTVTWAHHALQQGNRESAKLGLIITVLLGMAFTGLQVLEYQHALHEKAFGFGGELVGVYGSSFFMATGFHGAHVIIGTIFLAVCLFRLMKGHFTPEKHFGFEAAAWYWHFVDVVWLFLFAFVYVAFS
jgi:cytochrome c oxidase subunit III